MDDIKMRKSKAVENKSRAMIQGGGIIIVVTFGIIVGLVTGSQKNTAYAGGYNPRIIAADFTVNIDNPYFSLEPGTTFIYRSKTDEGVEINRVAVTDKTRKVMGVNTRVVWDRVWLNGELVEETDDWYAQDQEGSVWYFGEDSKEYENGTVVSTKGSWEAGINGAMPGIIMKAKPQLGKPYRQEYYEGKAEDMAEVVSLDETVAVPYGLFNKCIKTKDWNPLDPEVVEYKYYSPASGTVVLETEAGNITRVELIDIVEGSAGKNE